VAAELTSQANDVHQLEPMLAATATTLAAAGIAERPAALLADSGYWSIANLTEIEGAPELLIPPARHGRHGKPRKDGKPSESNSDGLRGAMKAKLASDDGKARYAKRRETVEPVFGQIKERQGAPGGSCAAAWVPARRSGSCCAAPTTCSSCGGTRPSREQPGQRSPERSQGALVEAAATAIDEPPEPPSKVPKRSAAIGDMAVSAFRNGLVPG
jgi:Transposase DDE domain